MGVNHILKSKQYFKPGGKTEIVFKCRNQKIAGRKQVKSHSSLHCKTKEEGKRKSGAVKLWEKWRNKKKQ